MKKIKIFKKIQILDNKKREKTDWQMLKPFICLVIFLSIQSCFGSSFGEQALMPNQENGIFSTGKRDLDVKTLTVLVKLCAKCSKMDPRKRMKMCKICLHSYEDLVKIQDRREKNRYINYWLLRAGWIKHWFPKLWFNYSNFFDRGNRLLFTHSTSIHDIIKQIYLIKKNSRRIIKNHFKIYKK